MSNNTIAYVRYQGPPDNNNSWEDRDTIERWVPVTHEQTVLDADPANLWFVDGETVEEVQDHFDAIYPPEQPGLSRVMYRVGGYGAGTNVTCVQVYPYECYRGDSLKVAAQLATESPTSSVVYQTHADMYSYDNLVRAASNRYDQRKQRYVRIPDAAEQYDCYTRVIMRDLGGRPRRVREIVYNPKIVARRKKARAKREAKQHTPEKREAIGNGPLQVWEINQTIIDMKNILPSTGAIVLPSTIATKRIQAVSNLMYVLNTIVLVYGEGYYRQYNSFRLLLERWQQRHEETKRRWANSEGQSDFVAFFAFLDKELGRVTKMSGKGLIKQRSKQDRVRRLSFPFRHKLRPPGG